MNVYVVKLGNNNTILFYGLILLHTKHDKKLTQLTITTDRSGHGPKWVRTEVGIVRTEVGEDRNGQGPKWAWTEMGEDRSWHR